MPTKEEWRVDVENTNKEIKAYQLLSEGFKLLASLPENSVGQSSLWYFKSRTYDSLLKDCTKFLAKLEKVKI